MFKRFVSHKVKGYTIIEMMVTLVLTSLIITMSYSALTYVQKMFISYKSQNLFIEKFTSLKDRINYEILKADIVSEESANQFKITRDSSSAMLILMDKFIVLTKGVRQDTFYTEVSNIKKEFELIKNPMWQNKLIQSLEFETKFTKQKFVLRFQKVHEASLKLELDKDN
jgi:prepilin-type N-terminal cleavage/methylation domain-containing protein